MYMIELATKFDMFAILELTFPPQRVDPTPYIEACKVDYCTCNSSRSDCICNSYEAYFRACQREGIKLQWRNSGRCRKY